MPISITQYRYTNYTFKIKVSGITSAVPFLHDKYTGAMTELTNGIENTVVFALNAAVAESSIDNRFDLVFEATTNVLATSESEFSTAVRIYPNPVTENQFEIALPESTSGISVQVTNMLGQEVFRDKLAVVNNKVTISPKTLLKSGVYVVTIKDGTKSVVKKITVK